MNYKVYNETALDDIITEQITAAVPNGQGINTTAESATVSLSNFETVTQNSSPTGPPMMVNSSEYSVDTIKLFAKFALTNSSGKFTTYFE